MQAHSAARVNGIGFDLTVSLLTQQQIIKAESLNCSLAEFMFAEDL
jgi:hypothetical protein